MSPKEWAGFILAILTTAGVLFTGLRWLIVTETTKVIHKEVPPLVKSELHIVNHELQNNGGSSTKDKIDYIFKEMKRKNDNR